MSDCLRACVAVLVEKNNRILLARRAYEPAKGKWDIIGGFIDPGESAEVAAIRETLEETNLDVRITKYLGSIPDVYGDAKIHTINFCFIAEVIKGEERAQSDVASLAWFKPNMLPDDMAFAHQGKVLQWYREYIQSKVKQDA
jgi:ADP-ribose pyrophosphatase YjhB (NUDIX family)